MSLKFSRSLAVSILDAEKLGANAAKRLVVAKAGAAWPASHILFAKGGGHLAFSKPPRWALESAHQVFHIDRDPFVFMLDHSFRIIQSGASKTIAKPPEDDFFLFL